MRRLARSLLGPLLAVLIALLIGAVLLSLSGFDPVQAYLALFDGAFGSTRAWQRTLEKATPLIFAGLAVAFGFRGGLFNIGAQGQLVLGAMTAAIIGFAVSGLPAWAHIGLALLAGALVGALFGAIPGVLKVYTGAHEVITTIMLNYVAVNLTDYLSGGPLKDPAGGGVIARTPPILESAQMPVWGPLPSGFVLSVLLAAVVYVVLNATTYGFEVRMVGQNARAARYAGVRVAWVVVSTMLLSGLMAGLGGAVETLGVVHRFQPGFNVGLGFEGITVALLGRNHPAGVILAALLVGAMKAGSNQMQFAARVPREILDVIMALMLFFVAADYIIRTLLRLREEGEERLVLTTGWGSYE